MVRDFPLDPELEDEVLKLVGQITVAFTALDYVLRLYVKSLLSAGFDVGMAVAAQHRYMPALCDLVFSLYKLKVEDEKAVKRFDKLLSDALTLSRRRNDLMHSFWTVDPDTDEVVLIKPTAEKGKGLRHGGGPVKVGELRRFLRSVSELAHKLDEHRTRELPGLLKPNVE